MFSLLIEIASTFCRLDFECPEELIIRLYVEGEKVKKKMSAQYLNNSFYNKKHFSDITNK